MNGGAAGLLLETLFVAEPMLDQHLRADRFLPPTPIRVVVDSAGKETELDPEEAIANLKPMAAATLQLPQVAAILPKLIEDARKIAEARTVVISEPEGDMTTYFQTLEKVIALQPSVIIPSHGIPMGGTYRIEATLQRLASIFTTAKDGDNSSD